VHRRRAGRPRTSVRGPPSVALEHRAGSEARAEDHAVHSTNAFSVCWERSDRILRGYDRIVYGGSVVGRLAGKQAGCSVSCPSSNPLPCLHRGPTRGPRSKTCPGRPRWTSAAASPGRSSAPSSRGTASPGGAAGKSSDGPLFSATAAAALRDEMGDAVRHARRSLETVLHAQRYGLRRVEQAIASHTSHADNHGPERSRSHPPAPKATSEGASPKLEPGGSSGAGRHSGRVAALRLAGSSSSVCCRAGADAILAYGSP
jgi:hypothetical protein